MTSIEQHELGDRLSEIVIGRKLVSVKGEVVTLDNGTKIRIEGSSDCCAWGDATIGKIIDSEHVITGVQSVDGDAEGSATVFLMTDAGTAMEIAQEWDESNGYYFYGLYLTVTEADAYGSQPDVVESCGAVAQSPHFILTEYDKQKGADRG